MATLRELRLQHGLTQAQLAQMLGKFAPVISSYEMGTALPDLEHMIVLENYFGQRIAWQELVTPQQKRSIIQGIIELCENYPTVAVMEFAARVYRRNQSPERLILHFANASQNGVQPLLPTEQNIINQK